MEGGDTVYHAGKYYETHPGLPIRNTNVLCALEGGAEREKGEGRKKGGWKHWGGKIFKRLQISPSINMKGRKEPLLRNFKKGGERGGGEGGKSIERRNDISHSYYEISVRKRGRRKREEYQCSSILGRYFA